MTPNVALVIDAPPGFGRLTAHLLAQRGYRVFGASRPAQAVSERGVEMLVLDVRSQESGSPGGSR